DFFSDAEAMAAFDLAGIGRAPARFDARKLLSLSGQHMAAAPDAALLAEVEAFLAATGGAPLPPAHRERFLAALPSAKPRAKTIPQLLEQARYALVDRPVGCDEAARAALAGPEAAILPDLTLHLRNGPWEREALEGA
ncbi:glutamate--tRNA ligase, partial [Corallococcus praedator]